MWVCDKIRVSYVTVRSFCVNRNVSNTKPTLLFIHLFLLFYTIRNTSASDCISSLDLSKCLVPFREFLYKNSTSAFILHLFTLFHPCFSTGPVIVSGHPLPLPYNSTSVFVFPLLTPFSSGPSPTTLY